MVSVFESDTDRKIVPLNGSSDGIPLFRRSNTKSNISQQTHMLDTVETGEVGSNMASPFHSLDSYTGGASVALNPRADSRSVALGDGSIEGQKTYSTLSSTTNRNVLLYDENNAGEEKGISRPSWILLQRGRLILLILAVVYGSLNISMRLVFARPDPPTASASSTIQGWFTVICFLPLLWRNQSTKNSNWCDMRTIRCRGNVPGMSFWRFALELAFFNFGTQALINLSLVGTQGARASFLVQMSVVFTPVLSVLFGKQRIGPKVWIGCFVALAGLFVLSYSEEEIDNQDEASENFATLSLSWGDGCCLMAALCWSLYIYRLSAWGEYFDETTTQFVKNIILATLYTLWMLIALGSRHYYDDYSQQGNEAASTVSLWGGWRNDPIAWLILFYSALGPCTLADVFQQKAQSSVPAAESNVILSMEPVFTTLLGLFLLGEIPSFKELGGGLLIMIASVIVSCGPRPSTSL